MMGAFAARDTKGQPTEWPTTNGQYNDRHNGADSNNVMSGRDGLSIAVGTLHPRGGSMDTIQQERLSEPTYI
jgi:hypothetical protein